MSEVQFRAATAVDVDAIVALVESAYRGDASRQGWTTEADFLEGQRTDADDVIACLERERSRILLAERDGVMLACAHVAEEGGAGYFGMFSVRPDLQGRGIGKRVLAAAEYRTNRTNSERSIDVKKFSVISWGAMINLSDP